MGTIIAQYVDTCLPCYLQDSHCRDGETLLLAGLGCSVEETVDALFDSLDCDADLPDDVTDEDIKEALRGALVGVDLRYVDENGDRCDVPADDRDDEEPYVYVVLQWNAKWKVDEIYRNLLSGPLLAC